MQRKFSLGDRVEVIKHLTERDIRQSGHVGFLRHLAAGERGTVVDQDIRCLCCLAVQFDTSPPDKWSVVGDGMIRHLGLLDRLAEEAQ